MASSLSKRHQARNEQALQDLVRTVPGNDRCADCQAQNPAWASWSLGIFLCVRCASLHRKLGTHVSKVKSLRMDSWTVDQVDAMRQSGNVKSNQKFNPRNIKPAVPLDADEADSAMERYIRQKYEQQSYMEGAAARQQQTTRVQSGVSGAEYTSDAAAAHPPKTPKSGRLFGILSSRKRDKGSDDMAHQSSTAAHPSGKVVGAAFGVTDEGMEWKLVRLRDMGFPDDNRNTSVLQGVNGDLERAIESLVRLGEGSSTASTKRPSAFSSQQQSRRTTPAPVVTRKPEAADGAFGASVGASPERATSPRQADPAQTDFWATIAPASAPVQPQQSLVGSFGNMQLDQRQLAPQSNPLFPNATGGHPSYNSTQPQAQAQMSMTNSVPQLPAQAAYNPYTQQATHNPFMSPGLPQAPHSASPYVSMHAPNAMNPFVQDPANATAQPVLGQQMGAQHSAQQAGLYLPQQQHHGGSPALQQQLQEQQQHQQLQLAMQQQQQQQQQVLYQQQAGFAQAQPQQQQQPFWPSSQVNSSPTQYSNPSYPPQLQNPYSGSYDSYTTYARTGLMPQPTGRMDKSSIMALYNHPQLAPQVASSDSGPASPSMQPAPPPLPTGAMPGNMAPANAVPPQRSVTMPVTGSKNPFAQTMSPTSPQQEPPLGMAPAENAGRHSPDAFASLSARFVR